LILGQPGIGKEALGYFFIRSGLVQGDYCLYATHRAVDDVIKDMKAFSVPTDRVPEWIAGSGSSVRSDLTDIASTSFNIKQAILRNAGRRIRVVTDLISPLLVLNPQPVMYQYWGKLLVELKESGCVVLGLVEDGMHPDSVVTALEQQFDGVIELRLFEEGLSITPLMRIRKMLGLPPQHGYFKFSFSKLGMEVMPNVR